MLCPTARIGSRERVRCKGLHHDERAVPSSPLTFGRAVGAGSEMSRRAFLEDALLSNDTLEAQGTTRVVFSMPRTPETWGGAAALWVTVAGWAAAARRRFGDALVLTPDGPISELGCLEASSRAPQTRSAQSRVSFAALTSLRALVGDASRLRAASRYTRTVVGLVPDSGIETRFVWSHYDLFHEASTTLARHLDVPLVAYVHAPVVWEASRWGVHRPGWGSLLERLAESPSLRRADLVACVSDDVREVVLRLGVAADRTIVAPMAVDADRFSPDVDGTAVRHALGLENRFVIGWVGSFRRFHGIELAVDALARVRTTVPEAALMLVGDGFERRAIEAHVDELGLSDAVHFVGQVGNDALPNFLRAFDVAVLTAREGQAFHYSPLKLREYMASGLAVVSPRIGEMARILGDGQDALLYPPGDVGALAKALAMVASDRQMAKDLGRAARSFVLGGSTWDNRLDQVCDELTLTSLR